MCLQHTGIKDEKKDEKELSIKGIKLTNPAHEFN